MKFLISVFIFNFIVYASPEGKTYIFIKNLQYEISLDLLEEEDNCTLTLKKNARTTCVLKKLRTNSPERCLDSCKVWINLFL